jgi:hypothetical protein
MGLLIAVFAISSTVFADYEYDKQSTTDGDSYWNQPILKLEVDTLNNLNANGRITFRISKIDGGKFTSSGKMYLKVGSYEPYGVNREDLQGDTYQNVHASVTRSILHTHDLIDYPDYPKEFYARFEGENGIDFAWVGPITISSVTTALPAPQLDAPLDNAQDVATTMQHFKWQTVSGASVYRIVVSTDEYFNNFEENPPDGSQAKCKSDTSCKTARIDAPTITYGGFSLAEGTTYYWKVRAGNSANDQGGEWSEIYSFTTIVSNPVMDVYPGNQHDFGTVTIGDSKDEEFTISNEGDAELEINNIYFYGGSNNLKNFKIENNNCNGAILESYESCSFLTKFSPKVAGADSAQVYIPSNAGDDYIITLEGVGEESTPLTPQLDLSPGEHDFGTIQVGETSPGKLFTIRNQGDDTLEDITFDTATDFKVRDNNCNQKQLSADETCTFKIEFTPTQAGRRDIWMKVYSNDDSEQILLKGMGENNPTPQTFSLTVNQPTNGRITSSPSGIDCSSACSHSYNQGTSVTLTAIPDSGYTFASWSGACSGSTTTCTLSMTAAKTVTANFVEHSSPPPGNSDSCEQHAIYALEEKILTIPLIEVPEISIIDERPTGNFGLFSGTLKAVGEAHNHFIIQTLVQVDEDITSSACHASYSLVDDTLFIPFVDVPTVVFIGGKTVQSSADVFAVTLRWLPISEVFTVEILEQLQ